MFVAVAMNLQLFRCVYSDAFSFLQLMYDMLRALDAIAVTRTVAMAIAIRYMGVSGNAMHATHFFFGADLSHNTPARPCSCLRSTAGSSPFKAAYFAPLEYHRH